MEKAIIQLDGLSCPSCMQKIESAVKALDGVDQESVKVLFNLNKVRVNFEPEVIAIREINGAIEKLGYSVIETKVAGD